MTKKEFIGAYNVGYRDGKTEEYHPTDYDDVFDIEQEPSVTQKSKTGHWIEDEYEMEVRCSECGEENDECSNYCPNCGAKMESEG